MTDIKNLEKFDIKNAKKLYSILKILQTNRNFKEAELIREALDKVYFLMHNEPDLFDKYSEEEIVNLCTKSMKKASEDLVLNKLTPGIASAIKVNCEDFDVTVYITRGVTNIVNEKVKLNHPITTTTKFDLASITKLFTIIQLLKENEKIIFFDLELPLNIYNPSFVHFDIPINQILTFNCEIETNSRLDETDISYNEALYRLKTSKIIDKFTHKYSDIGYMAIANAVPNFRKSFEKIFNYDLKLKNTSYKVEDNDISTGGPANKLNIVHDPKARIFPYAGHAGVFSTSEDLIKLYDALRNGYLSKDSLKAIVTPTLDPKYMTDDTMYLLNEDENNVPITRGMEYRHHPLGLARSEVAEPQSDNAFAAAGFTGTYMSVDYLPYKNNEELWYTTQILTNPLSADIETDEHKPTKPKGYAWKLDNLKLEELKAIYSLIAMNELRKEYSENSEKSKHKVYHI